MKLNAILALALLETALFFQTNAQVIKGRITDRSGVPVQYATVYVMELKLGTIANTKGDYELKIPEGNCMVMYQSLGYEPQIINISISEGEVIIRDVELTEQLYEIPEVSISASGEDPAYAIMRKTIGLAPYHLSQVNYYKANVYLKGNLVINKIPAIIRKQISAEHSENEVKLSAGGKTNTGKATIREGDSYLMESVNEIEFTAPDKYVQKVISFNSTFPDGNEKISPMDYIQASFYQPVLADMAISPLSPQAFSHYRFKYTGASLQGEYIINKIEVIPRRKSQQLFSGTIFIIEDLWCLQSVDLTNENLAGTIRIRELCIPVQEEIWMPVSHTIEFNLRMLGIRADAGYGSSVKYLDVKKNAGLQKPGDYPLSKNTVSGVPDTAVSVTQQKIENILNKEELTNRDMIRLANLMKKESEKSAGDSLRKNPEIKERTTHIIEEGAGSKDSTYWAEIRPIPLSETEIRSLEVRDSILSQSVVKREMAGDTIQRGKPLKRPGFKQAVSGLLTGHTWRAGNMGFTYGGLVDPERISFNPVDGFVWGNEFRISGTFKNGNTLSLYPDIRYAFSREKVIWRANASFTPGGLKEHQIYIRTGMTSRDLSSGTSVDPFINSLTSLLMKRNYLKLYESHYITAGFRSEIANGLDIEISGSFDNRKMLENSTSFSFIRSDREYHRNIPLNEFLDPDIYPSYTLANHRHYNATTVIRYTPFLKYSISNGRKINRGSEWPTFRFTWKHGVNQYPGDAVKYRNFDMFSLEASGERETGAFSEFSWKAGTGAFADPGHISWLDFFHFNTQPLLVLISDYNDAFMLPGFYSLATPEFYGEVHLKYTTPYLLLKYLPFLSNTLIRENITVSYLGSRHNRSYTEIGYTLSEVFLVGEAGIFAGFDNVTFNSIGAKIIIPFR
ncbi:MAG: DUF5686 and carboxypeptidase regulatory-like domain-containing protein [Bacteroidales bacterium]|jgi:hypothetical protein|nr:DUF5686 and carboxypeptidase regulatory-like domain-containing protein [Bacteroidales bacterium]